jgi:hypothetical protein
MLEPPALLLANLVLLMAIGLWARVHGARRMADTFATKQHGFAAPSPDARARLRGLIQEKHRLLAALDPVAEEATFSPSLSHWLSRPGLARRYVRLAREEARVMGQRASVTPAQAWWRMVHLVLAAVFVAGLTVHVVLVTFFAGWVADGGDVYWWHLSRWGG